MVFTQLRTAYDDPPVPAVVSTEDGALKIVLDYVVKSSLSPLSCCARLRDRGKIHGMLRSGALRTTPTPADCAFHPLAASVHSR